VVLVLRGELAVHAGAPTKEFSIHLHCFLKIFSAAGKTKTRKKREEEQDHEIKGSRSK